MWYWRLGRACAVDVRDTPRLCVDALSRAELPGVVPTREVADGPDREDVEVPRGVVAAFVRWREIGVAGLRFAALLGEEVVRVRGPVRVVIRVVVFASDISVAGVDAVKVRSRTLTPGTDRVVVDNAGFTGFD
jgi:hypothetical protein